VRNPRDFSKPLAIGAPPPLLEIPLTPSRMIHFFDPSNESMAAKIETVAARCDIVLGNLEDGVPVERKLAARVGLVRIAREVDLSGAALWARVNALASPWALDDIVTRAHGISTMSIDCSPNSRRRPACNARSWFTRSSRPRSASPTSRRSRPPARECRA